MYDATQTKLPTTQRPVCGARLGGFRGEAWQEGSRSGMRRLRSAGLGKSGASAAEYALILAVMGGGLVVAVLALTGSVNTAMNSVGTVLSSGT